MSCLLHIPMLRVYRYNLHMQKCITINDTFTLLLVCFCSKWSKKLRNIRSNSKPGVGISQLQEISRNTTSYKEQRDAPLPKRSLNLRIWVFFLTFTPIYPFQVINNHSFYLPTSSYVQNVISVIQSRISCDLLSCVLFYYYFIALDYFQRVKKDPYICPFLFVYSLCNEKF